MKVVAFEISQAVKTGFSECDGSKLGARSSATDRREKEASRHASIPVAGQQPQFLPEFGVSNLNSLIGRRMRVELRLGRSQPLICMERFRKL